MTLLADGGGFWVVKSLVDLLTILGFVAALISIWLTWWLARRDLSKRLAEAQRSAARMVERPR